MIIVSWLKVIYVDSLPICRKVSKSVWIEGSEIFLSGYTKVENEAFLRSLAHAVLASLLPSLDLTEIEDVRSVHHPVLGVIDTSLLLENNKTALLPHSQ